MDQDHKTIGALGTAISEASRAADALASEIAELTDKNQMLVSLAREVAGRLGIKHHNLSAEATITAIGDLAEKLCQEWTSTRDIADACRRALINQLVAAEDSGSEVEVTFLGAAEGKHDDPDHHFAVGVPTVDDDGFVQLIRGSKSTWWYPVVGDPADPKAPPAIVGVRRRCVGDELAAQLDLVARWLADHEPCEPGDGKPKTVAETTIRLLEQMASEKERADRVTSVMTAMAKNIQAIAVAAGWPEDEPVEDPAALVESVAVLRRHAERERAELRRIVELLDESGEDPVSKGMNVVSRIGRLLHVARHRLERAEQAERDESRAMCSRVCEILGEDDRHHPVDVIAMDIMGQLQSARAERDTWHRIACRTKAALDQIQERVEVCGIDVERAKVTWLHVEQWAIKNGKQAELLRVDQALVDSPREIARFIAIAAWNHPPMMWAILDQIAETDISWPSGSRSEAAWHQRMRAAASEGFVLPVNHQGDPLPASLRWIDPKHLDPNGPPHPDQETERAILRWAHGYNNGEPDPWSGRRGGSGAKGGFDV